MGRVKAGGKRRRRVKGGGKKGKCGKGGRVESGKGERVKGGGKELRLGKGKGWWEKEERLNKKIPNCLNRSETNIVLSVLDVRAYIVSFSASLDMNQVPEKLYIGQN